MPGTKLRRRKSTDTLQWRGDFAGEIIQFPMRTFDRVRSLDQSLAGALAALGAGSK